MDSKSQYFPTKENPKVLSPRLTLAVLECIEARDNARRVTKLKCPRFGIKEIADRHMLKATTVKLALCWYSTGRVSLNRSKEQLDNMREVEISSEIERSREMHRNALKSVNDTIEACCRRLKHKPYGRPNPVKVVQDLTEMIRVLRQTARELEGEYDAPKELSRSAKKLRTQIRKGARKPDIPIVLHGDRQWDSTAITPEQADSYQQGLDKEDLRRKMREAREKDEAKQAEVSP